MRARKYLLALSLGFLGCSGEAHRKAYRILADDGPFDMTAKAEYDANDRRILLGVEIFNRTDQFMLIQCESNYDDSPPVEWKVNDEDDHETIPIIGHAGWPNRISYFELPPPKHWESRSGKPVLAYEADTLYLRREIDYPDKPITIEGQPYTPKAPKSITIYANLQYRERDGTGPFERLHLERVTEVAKK